jgi:protein CMS1
MTSTNDDVLESGLWEGEDEQIIDINHDYSDDEIVDGDDNDIESEDDTIKVSKKELELKELEKKKKRQNKFDDLKLRKKTKGIELEAIKLLEKEEGSNNNDNNNRMKVNDMFNLYLDNQPETEIPLKDFNELNFYDGYQTDIYLKQPCPFVKAVAAGLPSYKKVLSSSSDEYGCPSIVVICAGAKRAADVINSMSQGLSVKIAKLFAKHFKVQEQMQILGRNHFPIAVGTPNRLSKLAEVGALKFNNTSCVLVDLAVDSKKFNVLTMTDVKGDFYNLMSTYIHPELNHLKVSLIPGVQEIKIAKKKKFQLKKKMN